MRAATGTSRSSGGAATGPDLSWRGLYRAGALSAVLYVVLIVVPVVLLFAAPQPPLSGGDEILRYIAENKAVYVIELVSFVGLSLPAIVVFLALYVALRHLDRSYAALGAVVGIASEIVALAYNSSPPSLNGGLLYLSDQYAAAATDAQRAALATAAEGLVAVSNAVNAAGILTAIGILIISLVMLKGAFPRGVAYLGIAAGAVGIVSEALRDMIGAGYFVYGLLLPSWFIAVGWTLFRLAGGGSIRMKRAG
ncbi:MAG TPA: DUF4386 family protein [Rubrobacteraceae bacterium]|nr:DUF4386 family protein [Rubrobacteraceae bacterium]